MFTITMSAKGHLLLPKAVREQLKLLPGSKVDVSIDTKNRVVFTPALHRPEELLRGRPKVAHVASIEEMDRGIAKAVRGRNC